MQQQSTSFHELASRGGERVAQLEEELSRFRLASLAAAGEAAGRFRECIRGLEAKVKSAEEENGRLLRQVAALKGVAGAGAAHAAALLSPASSAGAGAAAAADDALQRSASVPGTPPANWALDSARALAAAAARPLAAPTPPPGASPSQSAQSPAGNPAGAAPLLPPSASGRASVDWLSAYPPPGAILAQARGGSLGGTLSRHFSMAGAGSATGPPSAGTPTGSARLVPETARSLAFSSSGATPRLQRPASSLAAPFRQSMPHSPMDAPSASSGQPAAGAELRENLERLNERLVRTRAEWEASMSEIEGLIAKAPLAARTGGSSVASSPGISGRHTFSPS
eukprot:tig00000743_g3869.t1